MKRQKEWLEFENTRLIKLNDMKEDINKRKLEMEKLIGENGGDGEQEEDEDEDEDEVISYKRDVVDEQDEEDKETEKVDMDEDEDEELPTYSHEDESKANENKEEEEVSPVIDEISSNDEAEDERAIKRVKPNPIDEDDNYDPNANQVQTHDKEEEDQDEEEEDQDEEIVKVDSETIDHNAALAALLTKLG
ncbi:unnamed protein product [[Candida] boidinii]|nr:unnamed protein product [[Candida] boidinii]